MSILLLRHNSFHFLITIIIFQGRIGKGRFTLPERMATPCFLQFMCPILVHISMTVWLCCSLHNIYSYPICGILKTVQRGSYD